jgi:ferredoxin-NADP reductase
VLGVHPETATAKTFRLRLSQPSSYLAGQHYVVRLTAPDGYQASRSYSVASAPTGAPDGDREIEITVEKLGDGEVSGFLHDVVVPGDTLEVRGPIGGWFVWRGDGPALLIGGGSGVVPLMSMVRLARARGRPELVQLFVSVREPAELYYPDELPGPGTTIIYTRRAPAGWARPAGRLSEADLVGALAASPVAYVCGSPGFADAATDLLTRAGLAAERIRVERFGPSG